MLDKEGECCRVFGTQGQNPGAGVCVQNFASQVATGLQQAIVLRQNPGTEKLDFQSVAFRAFQRLSEP